jgi:hypothetical protein
MVLFEVLPLETAQTSFGSIAGDYARNYIRLLSVAWAC